MSGLASDIEFVRVESRHQIVSPRLRERAVLCGNLPFVTKFLATRASEQIGLLCVDQCAVDFFIYEICVLREFRGAGVGPKLLEYGERLACDSSCTRVGGKPGHLDDHTEQTRLVAWYRRRGYLTSEGEYLMKSIARRL